MYRTIVVKSSNSSRSRGHGTRMFPEERKRERNADSIIPFLRMRMLLFDVHSLTHTQNDEWGL